MACIVSIFKWIFSFQPGGSFCNKNAHLSPSEFLQTIVLPCISVETLWSPCTMTCKFAVELLLIALEAGCIRNCDWSEYEFEPMALVLSLAEIKHECVALWETENELTGNSSQKELNKMVAMETKAAKNSLKEKVNQCIERICLMISERNIVVPVNGELIKLLKRYILVKD